VPSTYVVMATIPNCDFSRAHGRAYADAYIPGGGWANVCEACFRDYGCRLGTGAGQELLLPEEAKERGLS